MNFNTHAFRSASDDRLVINDETRHQYYSTMQAEVYDEDMLDAALNRRQARAFQAREQRRNTGWMLAAGAAVALAALAAYLF